MAFRYDDEVFTLLLPGVELVTPSAVAERVRLAAADEPFPSDGTRRSVTSRASRAPRGAPRARLLPRRGPAEALPDRFDNRGWAQGQAPFRLRLRGGHAGPAGRARGRSLSRRRATCCRPPHATLQPARRRPSSAATLGYRSAQGSTFRSSGENRAHEPALQIPDFTARYSRPSSVSRFESLIPETHRRQWQSPQEGRSRW